MDKKELKRPQNGDEFVQYLLNRVSISDWALPKEPGDWAFLAEELDDYIIPGVGMDRMLMCVDFLAYDIFQDREFDFFKMTLRSGWFIQLSKLNRRTWDGHEEEIKKRWDKLGIVIPESKEQQKDDFCNLCFEIDMIWSSLSFEGVLAGDWLKNPPFQRWCLDKGFEKGDGVEQIDDVRPFTPENCRIVKGKGAVEKEALRKEQEKDRREMDEINAKIKYD